MLLTVPLIITLPELYEYFTERSLNPKGAWHIKFGLTRSSALETDLDDSDNSIPLSINITSVGLSNSNLTDVSACFIN